VPRIVGYGHSSSGWGSLKSRGGTGGNGGSFTRGERWSGWEGRKRPEGVDENVNVVVVRAGEVIRIDLEITGSPIPLVTWAKDRKAIQQSNRVN